MGTLRVTGVQHVAVCVCTAFRPKMLEACLLSLCEQLISPAVHLDIVVVDNEPEPNNQGAVESIAYGSVYPFHYVHQPKRGIASARNTAIEKALSLRADWIAFIDDDETADQDWIAQLMHSDYLHVPILGGTNITEFPDSIPEWLRPRTKPRAEGCGTVTGTGNIRIAASVFERLRFNEAIGLGGGEDGQFLLEARAAGFETRHTARAITHEVAHPERCTAKGIIIRSYWIAAANMREEMIKDGRWKAIRHRLPAIACSSLVATGQLAIGAARFLYNRHTGSGRRKMLGAGKSLAVAAGRVVAILGHIPQPYRDIHGS